MATLEAETGAGLGKRAANGARLTEAGEVLVRHAEVIFAALDEAESELRAVLGLEAGRLRLATFSSAAANIVPLAIERIHLFDDPMYVALPSGHRVAERPKSGGRPTAPGHVLLGGRKHRPAGDRAHPPVR